jgi:hypothetical protein
LSGAAPYIKSMNNERFSDTHFEVRSINFSWHEPVVCETAADALAKARERGFEASIYVVGKAGSPVLFGASLVATWSPLYGTTLRDRRFA